MTYLAIRGIVEEVGGRIFETKRRKTTIDRRTDTVKVIFSVESVGRKSTDIERKVMRIVGIINTTV